MNKWAFCRLLMILLLPVVVSGPSYPQGAPSFIIPDTVCVGQPVVIQNILQGSSFYWNFCTGNANDPPVSIGQGNPGGNLSDPAYITILKDNTDCYSFVTNPGNSSVTRNYYGKSFFNTPVTSDNLGNFGVFSNLIRGLQVRNDNGTWYGFVACGNIYRMNFPAGLMGTPTVNVINSPGMTAPGGLVITKEGTQWIGLCTDLSLGTVNRLVFGNTLANAPVVQSLGNPGSFNNPAGIALQKSGGNWYLFVCNEGDSTLSRLEFGNSLMNAPTGSNLGNVGGLAQCTGITLTVDCGQLTGYVVNHVASANPLVKLVFDGGLSGTVTGIPLGNGVNLGTPYGISEMLRVGDTVYSAVTNTSTSTLSMMYFPVCTASSIPSWSGPNPPPVTYDTPGNYNIVVTVDEGTATQTGSCQNLTVIPALTVSLGPDQVICSGGIATLDAGPGYSGYLWSTGASSETITTDTAGTFWVDVSNTFGCGASDTVIVTASQAVSSTLDTTLCYGDSLFAGGKVQTISGTYYDSLMTTSGCDSIVITNLTVQPQIVVDIGNDTVYCPGDQILLNATVPGATYLWQDGSVDSVYLVAAPGTYWAEVTLNGCTVSDSALISPCPVRIWFPTAFTPDNDGLNDTFRPQGISIGKFRMVVFDRWGTEVFNTTQIQVGWDGTYKGDLCAPEAYSWRAWYSSLEEPGKTYEAKGSVVLVR